MGIWSRRGMQRGRQRIRCSQIAEWQPGRDFRLPVHPHHISMYLLVSLTPFGKFL